jgi:hypothetical protein
VPAYNTRTVGKREVPQQLEDLLRPRWKSKLAMGVVQAHPDRISSLTLVYLLPLIRLLDTATPIVALPTFVVLLDPAPLP